MLFSKMYSYCDTIGCQYSQHVRICILYPNGIKSTYTTSLIHIIITYIHTTTLDT